MYYSEVQKKLHAAPKKWLITGVAGFIGSNLLESLLKLEQRVVGIDNFSTGYRKNLVEVQSKITSEQWNRFCFLEGDITCLSDCRNALDGVDYVLHQAALGSVPRSIADPIATNSANITGFLNMLVASKDAQVKSFTYAASSSTYGDNMSLPKIESVIGNPLSPYAITKYVNELYAENFSRVYGFRSIGLRYFNVFGKRQDPHGTYAAVIPKWINSMIDGEEIFINGDGETSRDFCFVENAIQMNILSAVAPAKAKDEVFNVAVGDRTSLSSLFDLLKSSLIKEGVDVFQEPKYRDFREGDIRHTQADINKAINKLGYDPQWSVLEGIEKVMPWYIDQLKRDKQK